MREAGVTRITFQEIMQVRQANQSEVAKSFYHVLGELNF